MWIEGPLDQQKKGLRPRRGGSTAYTTLCIWWISLSFSSSMYSAEMMAVTAVTRPLPMATPYPSSLGSTRVVIRLLAWLIISP